MDEAQDAVVQTDLDPDGLARTLASHVHMTPELSQVRDVVQAAKGTHEHPLLLGYPINSGH